MKPILCGDIDISYILQNLGNLPGLIYMTAHYHEDFKISKTVDKFFETYVKLFGHPPTSISATYFDAYLLALDSIERAKSFDREKINYQIRNTKNFVGITGSITIDSNTGDAEKSVLILQIRQGLVTYVTRITKEILGK